MDDSAIIRIEELATSATQLPETDIPAVALPGGTTTHSLEKFMAQPARQRATVKTQRLQSFIDYSRAESDADSIIFIDDRGNGAHAIFDYGTGDDPQWKEHAARYVPEFSPAFEALKDRAETGGMSQRTLIDWIEDWHDIVTAYQDADGETAIPIAQALAAIRRVDIKSSSNRTHNQGDFNASVSSLDEVGATSNGTALPGEFRVKCRIYSDLDEREIRARLTLRSADGTPKFGLRIVGYDQLMQDTAEEIKTQIEQAFDCVCRTYSGALA